jgi:hypothetical protein
MDEGEKAITVVVIVCLAILGSVIYFSISSEMKRTAFRVEQSEVVGKLYNIASADALEIYRHLRDTKP